jgi:hypothetical protein
MMMITLGMVTLTGLASVTPTLADPYDYRWCAQGASYGYPGECMYQTYEQCLATVSGQYLSCGENPRFLFREQSRSQLEQQPRPRRRPRHVHRY